MLSKKLGQHWLFDKEVLSRVVKAAQITSSDTVLEIGPGLGTLTEPLVSQAKKVIAVEKDFGLAKRLARSVLATQNLEVVNADILEFDLGKLSAGYKVAANIPYYLTSNLLRRLLEDKNPPSVMGLMLQKEVAERIVAKPGQMSLLAFSVQYYGQAKIVDYVSKEKFTPPPKVDSAIIQIIRQPKPAFKAEPKKLFRFVKAGFSAKRKMLKNNLSAAFGNSTQYYSNVLKDLRISEQARAQELSLKDWQRLYKEIEHKQY